MSNKNFQIKKMIIIVVAIVITASILNLHYCLRSEATYVARKGKLFFLQNMLTVILSDSQNNIIPVSEGNISWREQIVNYCGFGDSDSTEHFTKMFRSFDEETGDYTSYVAVTGNRTVWDNEIRKKILFTDTSFDKILLIEIPQKNIPWNSTQDYDVEKILNLWTPTPYQRGFFQKSGLLYITLRGKIGDISDFTSKDELRKMIELNDNEMLSLSTHVPPLKNTELKSQTDEK
jgi:hypothetical protein